MRIIAGSLRGRRLVPVRGRLRPTSDRVREAIFNILGPLVAEAQVLDLFAGTGALSFEALSRGAGAAVLVEEHPASLAILRRNLEILDLAPKAHIVPLPVHTALKKLAAQGPNFGLAFLDPPYETGLAARSLRQLLDAAVLLPGAYVVSEHSCREVLPAALKNLRLIDSRRYGDTQVSFYTLDKPPNPQEFAG